MPPLFRCGRSEVGRGGYAVSNREDWLAASNDTLRIRNAYGLARLKKSHRRQVPKTAAGTLCLSVVAEDRLIRPGRIWKRSCLDWGEKAKRLKDASREG